MGRGRQSTSAGCWPAMAGCTTRRSAPSASGGREPSIFSVAPWRRESKPAARSATRSLFVIGLLSRVALHLAELNKGHLGRRCPRREELDLLQTSLGLPEVALLHPTLGQRQVHGTHFLIEAVAR